MLKFLKNKTDQNTTQIEDSKHDKTNHSFTILIFVIGVLFIAGHYIAIGQSGEEGWILKSFLYVIKDVGIAFIVSVVVLYAIEILTHRNKERATDKLVKDINKNLFGAIYNRYIPDIIFNEVERCLMANGVVRSNYRVVYTLKKKNEGIDVPDGYYLCTLRSRYKLKNIAGGPVDEIVRARLELPIDDNLHKYVKFCKAKIDGQTLNESDIEKHSSSDKNNTTFSFKVTVPPEGLEVDLQGQMLKKLTDQEVWTTSYPAEGLELIIISPLDCKVKAFANHSKSSQVEEDRENISDDAQKYELKLNYGIIPFQSFVIWWSSDESSATIDETPENNN